MNPEIRLLEIPDLYAVKELGKLTWEGGDYLGKVAKGWIEDGGFLGLFEGDNLIGCAKISRLPDQVVWLEGLRVHPDHQKQGLGKLLAGKAMDLALHLVRSGEAAHIEFSTYYQNLESIHISTQAGFAQCDEYYILSHKPVKPVSSQHHQRIHEDVTDYFPVTVPYGWKFLHPVKQALNWLNKRAHLIRAGGGYFYVAGDSPVACLLTPAGDWLHDALPYIQYAFGKKNQIEILLHKSREFEIGTLMELGFHWWEEGTPDKVLVFRHGMQGS